MAYIICKQDKARGRQAAPRGSHRTAEPTVWSILKKKDAYQKAVSWKKTKLNEK